MMMFDRGDFKTAVELADRHLRRLPAQNRTERVAARRAWPFLRQQGIAVAGNRRLSEKALVERYRLITLRQRRLARSTNGPLPVSFAEHAADAAELLGHLDVRRRHVAGHSTGAAIALQLAVDRPDIVHTLALLEPPLVGVPSAGAFFEKAGPALAAYGSGDRDGAMAGFLSVVCSLDWETCRKVMPFLRSL